MRWWLVRDGLIGLGALVTVAVIWWRAIASGYKHLPTES